jgi:hypothetical protein
VRRAPSKACHGLIADQDHVTHMSVSTARHRRLWRDTGRHDLQ